MILFLSYFYCKKLINTVFLLLISDTTKYKDFRFMRMLTAIEAEIKLVYIFSWNIFPHPPLLQIMLSLRSKVFLCNGVPHSIVQINISIKDIICIGYTSIKPIPVIPPWLLIQVLFICSGIIIKSLIFFQNLIRKCLVSSHLARQYLAVRYNMFISFQVSIRRSVCGGGWLFYI